MLENPEEIRKVIYTTGLLLKADGNIELYQLFNNSEIVFEKAGYDNWNGGVYFFTVFLIIDVETFVKNRERIEVIEAELLAAFEIGTRYLEGEEISRVQLVPKAHPKIDWTKTSGITTKAGLLRDISFLKNTMISVSTGGQRIQEINDQYKQTFNATNKALQRLGFQNPNQYSDLWDWYGKWSSDFSTYRERRAFIRDLYASLTKILEDTEDAETVTVTVDLTGWERLERSINEIRKRQSEAEKEEQFQVIGLLCRETIITLAQSVFVEGKHRILDDTKVSKTDVKRMLEAYIAVELAGSSNETLRKYARATLELANELTHKRTATKRDGSLCSIATLSLINFIGTIEGRI
ncbi:hypothetical protein SAMN05192529_11782 [Arachidicoccus rhizosphaerae]|uniref:Abortive infection C-terminus n=1 Tax=Arachidicoccus rhizosphaerae TaxID=551991 RepID=A0A1H4B0V1_9BACT|nr:hypothetical protein [Arachidicoccus rhizosphaerae]SEA41687.1 hypothetical protein SAMN05192529_11782 [Arachidicoccus rhizosphaerae]